MGDKAPRTDGGRLKRASLHLHSGARAGRHGLIALGWQDGRDGGDTGHDEAGQRQEECGARAVDTLEMVLDMVTTGMGTGCQPPR